MHLKNFVAVVRCRTKAHLLSDLLLDLIKHVLWSAEIYVTVKATVLEATKLVLSLTHHVGYTLCGRQITCAVWHNDIFSGNKQRHLTL